MLTNKSVVAAATIANSAVQSGRLFVPKTNTPLFILGAAMKFYEVDEQTEDFTNLLVDASRDDLSAITSHSGEMEVMASNMARRISFNQKQVRNVINPLIRQIFTACEKRKQLIAGDNPLNSNVIHHLRPAIYDTAAIENMIAVYNQGNFPFQNVREGLRSKLTSGVTAESFLELVSTGDSLTTAVKEGLAVLESRGVMIEDVLFSTTPRTGIEPYVNFSSIFTFLFLKAVNAGKLKTFDIADLESEDRIQLSRAMAGYGQEVNYVIRSLDGNENNVNFVLPVTEDKRVINVVDSAYQKWLSAGGTLEALLAYNATPLPERRNNTLINNPDVYQKEHERLSKVYERRSVTLSTLEIENIIDSEMTEYMIDEYDDSSERADYVQALRAYMKENRMYVGSDMYNYVAKVVCEVLGRDYDAYLIHTDMRLYMDDPENSDKGLGDAASNSVARLLGRWIASQITVDTTEFRGYAEVAPSLKNGSY